MLTCYSHAKWDNSDTYVRTPLGLQSVTVHLKGYNVPSLFVKCFFYSCLVIGLGTAEAKDEQMAMGVCAGEALAIRSEFAVENSSMTLTFNLDEKHKITQGKETH